MAGFDWRAQVAATPWDWVEFYAPAEPVERRKAARVRAVQKRASYKRPTGKRKPFACSLEHRREIADAYLNGDEPLRSIAARYGISPPTVLNYAKGVEL